MAASVGRGALRSVRSVFRPDLFEGRVAVVTGGATGIGRAIASELALLSCKVVIASRNEERLAAAASEISAAEGVKHKVEAIACNIREPEQVADLFTQTVDTCGAVDFLVNNGGGQFPSPAANISDKGWRAVIDTNLNGTFTCSREAYRSYMSDHGGAIVNIVADMWKGFPGMWYAGGVIYSQTAVANYEDPTLFNQFIPFVPAKRLGTTEEVAASVVFLLSPAAAFITGETVKVDGGSSLYAQPWPIPPHSKLPAFGDLPEVFTSAPKPQAKEAEKGGAGGATVPRSKL